MAAYNLCGRKLVRHKLEKNNVLILTSVWIPTFQTLPSAFIIPHFSGFNTFLNVVYTSY